MSHAIFRHCSHLLSRHPPIVGLALFNRTLKSTPAAFSHRNYASREKEDDGVSSSKSGGQAEEIVGKMRPTDGLIRDSAFISQSDTKSRNPGHNTFRNHHTESVDFFGFDSAKDTYDGPIEFPESLPRNLRKKYINNGEDKKEKTIQFEQKLYGYVRYDKIRQTQNVASAERNESFSPKLGEAQKQQEKAHSRKHLTKPVTQDKTKLEKSRSANSLKSHTSESEADCYIDDQYFTYEGQFKDKLNSNQRDKYLNSESAEVEQKSESSSRQPGKLQDFDKRSEELNYIDNQYFSTERNQEETDRDRNNKACIENAQMIPDKLSNCVTYEGEMNDIDRQYFAESSATQAIQSKSKLKGLDANDTKDRTMNKKDPEFRKRQTTEEKGKIFSETLKRQDSISAKESDGKTQRQTTAYDLSMKIRKEKERTNSVNLYGEMNPRELDSKGFRILKNQVPHFDNAPSIDVRHVLRQSVIYNRDDIVAINKPYGIPSHDGPGVVHSMSNFLDSLLPKTQLFPVHRLDQETTGIMLFAKTEDRARELSERFERGNLKKRYLAITKNIPKLALGEIDIPISEVKVEGKIKMTLKPHYSPDLKPVMKKRTGGSDAITRYRILATSDKCALLECVPLTGKKHQIRVHLAYGLDCPILGDHKYSHFNRMAPMKLHPVMLQKLRIQQSKVRHLAVHLHARSIAIPEYLNGRTLFVSAPLPPHFIKNMKSLKLKLPKNM